MSNVDVRAARAKLRRDVIAVLVALGGIWMLASVDRAHNTIRGTSGRAYSLLSIGKNLDGTAELVVRFRVADSTYAGVKAAMLDFLPRSAAEAAAQQDSALVMIATYQRYHIGWFYHNNLDFVRQVRIHNTTQ